MSGNKSLNTTGFSPSNNQADASVWKDGKNVAGAHNTTKITGGNTSTVVQKVIDKIHSNGGGRLHIHPGDYPQTKNIYVYPNIDICGSGWDKTTFTAQSPCGWRTHPSVSNLHHFSIRNLTFDGGDCGGEANQILFDGYPTQCVARNVRVANTGPRGSSQTSRGLEFRGGCQNTIFSCTTQNCAGTSLSIQDGVESVIHSCDISKPNSEAPYTHAITMDGTTKSVVRNCFINGSITSPTGISCVDASNGLVIDNTLKNVDPAFDVTNADVEIRNNRVSGKGTLAQASKISTTAEYEVDGPDEVEMNVNEKDADIETRICPNCGDEFNVESDEVVESDNGTLYCSIGCLNGL